MEHYLAAWRYEISFLELKKYFTSERSERVKYFFNTRREISYLCAHVICSISTPLKHTSRK